MRFPIDGAPDRTGPTRPAATIQASRAARRRAAHGPGTPPPISAPSRATSAWNPATDEQRSASSAATTSSGVIHASDAARPSAAAPSGRRSQSRVVPARIPAAKRRRQHTRTNDQRHVRGRRLGDVPVDGDGDGVLGTGQLRLELGVDVIGARDGLHRRQRVGRVPSTGGDHRPNAPSQDLGADRHVGPALDDDRRDQLAPPGGQQAPTARCAPTDRDPNRGIVGRVGRDDRGDRSPPALRRRGAWGSRGCPCPRAGAPGAARSRSPRRAARGASRRGRRRAGSRGRRRGGPESRRPPAVR